jgi:GTP-binding protein
VKARFVASAPRVDILPRIGLPEIGFAGRSNVGKSSLIGGLLGQPKLVRTSRTPGRTQTLNLFVFEERMAVVDLPGYGYAKLSKAQRAEMEQMVQEYLRRRDELRGAVLVMDARRDPVSPYDAFVASWLLEIGRPVLIAITKSDLVPKNRRVGRARTIEKQLKLPAGCAVVCSSHTGEGRDELLKRLDEITSGGGA